MYLAWLCYLILIVGLFFLFRTIVKYYIDPSEYFSFAMISICISFTTSMICILMVPIDVFVTSHPVFIYLYGFLLLITFLLLPFNYFYAEQRQLIQEENDFDIDFSEKRETTKIKTAAKKTVFIFTLSIFLLLIMGLYFRPDMNGSYERGKEVEWIKNLFDVEHVGEQALGFCISIILSFGSSLWFIYGAYGLAALPLYLIKGYKSLTEERDELDKDLLKLKDRYRGIQDKYSRTHAKISKQDQKALNNLKRRERLLQFKNDKIQELQNQSKSLQAIFKIIMPFRILIGLTLLLCSLSIFVSFLINTYQRINQSVCGLKCGYLIEHKSSLNPIDNLFIKSSFYFPLDYLIFFIYTLYIFICTLYGIIKLGINFLCIKSLAILKEQTHPQALFIVAFILNISILVLCNQLMSLCPQYATFGNQSYYDIKSRQWEMCTLEAVTKVEAKFICQMTNLSSFYNKISMGFPLFAVVFFLSNCAFLFLNSICLLYFLCKSKISRLDTITEDLIEYDDEGLRLLA